MARGITSRAKAGAKTDVDEAPSPLTECRRGVGALSRDVLIMHVRAESAAGDAAGWLAGASTTAVIRHTDGITAARSTRRASERANERPRPTISTEAPIMPRRNNATHRPV